MRGFRSLRPGPRAGPGGGRRRSRPRRPASSRTALVTIRRGEMSSGIEPGGITRVEEQGQAAGDDDGHRGHDDRLHDEAGEQRSTPRADRLQDAVEAEAFHREQGEEQGDDDDGDGDRHADDLVERRALLLHARDGVDGLGDGERLGRAAGRGVDRRGHSATFAVVGRCARRAPGRRRRPAAGRGGSPTAPRATSPESAHNDPCPE